MRDVLQRLASGDTPLNDVWPAFNYKQPPDAVSRAMIAYVHCRAVQDATVCDRLAPELRAKCRANAGLVSARARSEQGWGTNEAFLARCQESHMDETACRLVGLGLETGNPAPCSQMSPRVAPWCTAVATGNAAGCDQVPHELSCRDDVELYSQLRRGGVAALRGSSNPSLSAYAAGTSAARDACGTFVRAHLRDIVGAAERESRR